ncbi:MAG: type VI secretion system protein IglI family protein [Methylobacter sp.]
MRIVLLQGNLPVSENPGLDSTDPRIDDIATLVQSGHHAEAASQSEAILVDGIYDIRLICYFLYGHWLEAGLLSFFDVISCLNNVLENWEAVGPVKNREKSAEKSLDWLFKQSLKKIQYEENKNTPLWQQWQADFSADEVDQILDLGETFRLNLDHRLEANANIVIALWSKVEQWLQTYQQMMYRPPEALEQDEAEAIEDDSPTEEIFPTVMAKQSTGLEIESSYHMELLLEKLAAFERLLQEEKFPQAAVVAVDINETLSNFDPKIYFPKIFESFVRLQALNFEELSVYAENQDSPQWQVMQDWLKVDVNSFINN